MNKENRVRRARMVRMKAAAQRWGEQVANRMINLAKAREKAPVLTEDHINRRTLTHGMSNWQRNQALRECKGILTDLPTDRMAFWAVAPHYKKARSCTA